MSIRRFSDHCSEVTERQSKNDFAVVHGPGQPFDKRREGLFQASIGQSVSIGFE
jgi:hypothetical protein